MTDLRYQKGYNAVVQSVALFRGAVALSEGVHTEQVIPTCGATGALDAIFRATALEHFKAGKKPTAVLGYPEYFDAQRQLASSGYLMRLVNGPTAGPYQTNAVRRNIHEKKPNLFYVSVPHNPTGFLLPREEVDALIDACGEETRIIIDKTLIHPEEYLRAQEIEQRHPGKDIVIVSSFSKRSGLVKERVGYLTATRMETVAEIPLYAHSPSCNSIEAAINELNSKKYRDTTITAIEKNNRKMQEWSASHQDAIAYHSSRANFGMLELKRMNASTCKDLLEEEGVLTLCGDALLLREDRFLRIALDEPSESITELTESLDHILTA